MGTIKPKHIPTRTCLGCGRKSAKHELVRVVRTVGAMVEVDRTGNKSGRGVYLCRQSICWEFGLQKGRLEHSLRGPIPSLDRQALLAYAQGLNGALDPE